MYVKELRENLLSVSKLTEKGIRVEFEEKVAKLKQNGKVLLKAPRNGNLYELKLEVNSKEANIGVVKENQLWHKRMGHASDSAMQELVRHEMVSGLTKFSPVGTCEVCLKGKQCRLPFDGARPKTHRILERIHSDVCGPFNPSTCEGYRYTLSIIDDFSHFTVISLLKKKSEVFEKIREYEAMATAMHNVKIFSINN